MITKWNFKSSGFDFFQQLQRVWWFICHPGRLLLCSEVSLIKAAASCIGQKNPDHVVATINIV